MIWVDACGRGTEAEVRECPQGHAMLHVASADGDPLRVCLRQYEPGSARSLARALRDATGGPLHAPGPTPYPVSLFRAGPVAMSVEGSRRVRVQAGAVTEVWPSGQVRELAGKAVAVADAADAEPDSADVGRMASLFTEASRMAPEDAARYLLGKGVRLPGGDGGND